jgi:hypothetical protein
MEPGELKRMYDDLLAGLGETELKAQIESYKKQLGDTARPDDQAMIILKLWEQYVQPMKRRHG